MAKRGTKSGGSLRGVSAADLRRELARRESGLAGMIRERDSLLAKADAIDAEIRLLEGEPVRAGAGGRRGRPAKKGRAPARGRRRGGGTGMGAATREANAVGLAPSLAKMLAGKTMGVTEAAVAVQKAGYKTNADNFRTIVNACLIKNKKLFRKVSRGKYTAA